MFILNAPEAQISKAGAAFMPPGRNIEVKGGLLGPLGAGFLNYVCSGSRTCQVMHSGLEVMFLTIIFNGNS